MEEKKMSLTRREALKTVAALTGAVALSSLPNNWQKPAVAVGSLPAFAQRLSGVYIVPGSLELAAERPGAGGQDGPGASLIEVRIEFDYENAVGGVAAMDVTFDWESWSGQDNPAPPPPTTHVAVNNPDGTPGHIDHVISDVMAGGPSAEVSIFIVDGGGTQSNTVTGELTPDL